MKVLLTTILCGSVWMAFGGKRPDKMMDPTGSSNSTHLAPADCKALQKATPGISSWIPACNSSTNRLIPIQTMNTGQKFCVDIVTTGVLLGPSSDPKLVCKCAIRAKRARLQDQAFVPQCNNVTGLFEPRQCDFNERNQCWCVDWSTGVEVAKSSWSATTATSDDNKKCPP